MTMLISYNILMYIYNKKVCKNRFLANETTPKTLEKHIHKSRRYIFKQCVIVPCNLLPYYACFKHTNNLIVNEALVFPLKAGKTSQKPLTTDILP